MNQIQSKRLYRSQTNRYLGGVCGGLGEYFDIDPLIFRLLFIVLVIFGGSGVLIYILMWILIPEESTSESDNKKGENKMMHNHHNHHSGRGRYVGGLIILVIGLIFLLNNLFPNIAIGFDKLWPVILIIIGLGVLLGAGGRHYYEEDKDHSKKSDEK